MNAATLYLKAYRAALAADAAYDAVLTAEYKRDACNRRYDYSNALTPAAVRAARDAFHAAAAAMQNAVVAMRDAGLSVHDAEDV